MELRHRCGNDGIILPEGWESFENFFAALGHAPDPKSVLWIRDQNRGFDEADNWEWISRQEFSNQRRDNFMLDEVLRLGDASKIFRINRETLRKRKLRGLPIEQILSRTRYLKGPGTSGTIEFVLSRTEGLR